jgi:N-acyl-D-amino-acid deacylase
VTCNSRLVIFSILEEKSRASHGRAERHGLANRGLLKEGFFADITIFDPSTIEDKATYTEPAQLAQGVKFVFVNGQLEFADGQLTGAKAGRPLLGPGAANALP